ncbi:MAG TPA: hypothetical protein VH062_19445 [Polyangiaceae bacterium]|nr:hypothetical protein [Polyangiaceae bacterium]
MTTKGPAPGKKPRASAARENDLKVLQEQIAELRTDVDGLAENLIRVAKVLADLTTALVKRASKGKRRGRKRT